MVPVREFALWKQKLGTSALYASFYENIKIKYSEGQLGKQNEVVAVSSALKVDGDRQVLFSSDFTLTLD